MSRLKVWVICGGPSGEAEVSRASARGVVAALERAGHDPVLVEFEPTMVTRLLQQRPDVAFPITHGTLGEDGCLQGLLEVFDLPYVGCDVLASALGANKPYAKALWRNAGLPVADESLVRQGDDISRCAREIRASFPGSLAIKPASGGSAIGVYRIESGDSAQQLEQRISSVLQLDSAALVEPWLAGREVTCGVLELAPRVRALPPTLILPNRADFYDFASKYAPGGSKHLCPAPLAAALVERIQALAIRAHQVIGARDLSRVDFIVEESTERDGAITILEINTLPGMTSTSLFPEAAGCAGISFETLVDELVRRAFSRRRPTRANPLAMPT